MARIFEGKGTSGYGEFFRFSGFSISPSNSVPLTVALWVKFTGSSSHNGVGVAVENSGSTARVRFTYLGSAAQIRLNSNDGTTNSNANFGEDFLDTGWHHIVFTEWETGATPNRIISRDGNAES